MSFPLTSDYALAVKFPKNFVFDPVLREGEVVLGKDKDPLVYSGGFARVFMFRTPNGRRFALRCWTADCGDSLKIYTAAKQHLEPLKLPHFAEFCITNDGILAANKKHPILRMEWVDGLNLKEFLAKNLNNPNRLSHIRQRFLAACSALHQHKIAHGDLQPENIKVRSARADADGKIVSSEEIVFIDYDTLCVPALKGSIRVNSGLPAYQHPKRSSERTAELHDDYFSELVLYVTILAIERRPSLWEKWRLDERDKELIFNDDDYRSPRESPSLKDIASIGGEVAALVEELRIACEATGLRNLEPLETILARVAQGKGRSATNSDSDGPRKKFEILLNGGKTPPPLPNSSGQQFTKTKDEKAATGLKKGPPPPIVPPRISTVPTSPGPIIAGASAGGGHTPRIPPKGDGSSGCIKIIVVVSLLYLAWAILTGIFSH